MIMTGKTKTQYDEEIQSEKASLIRGKRDLLLHSSIDTINAIRYSTMKEKDKKAWEEYRQALLDVPQQEGFPDNIIWPTPPTEE